MQDTFRRSVRGPLVCDGYLQSDAAFGRCRFVLFFIAPAVFYRRFPAGWRDKTEKVWVLITLNFDY